MKHIFIIWQNLLFNFFFTARSAIQAQEGTIFIDTHPAKIYGESIFISSHLIHSPHALTVINVSNSVLALLCWTSCCSASLYQGGADLAVIWTKYSLSLEGAVKTDEACCGVTYGPPLSTSWSMVETRVKPSPPPALQTNTQESDF